MEINQNSKTVFGPPKIVVLKKKYIDEELLQEIVIFYKSNDKKCNANPVQSVEELRQRILTKNHYCYLAYLPNVNDKKQSLVGVMGFFAYNDIAKFYLATLVTEQNQSSLSRRGIGRILIEYCKYIGISRRYKCINLSSGNSGSNIFYEKCGFIGEYVGMGFTRYTFDLTNENKKLNNNC
jgi:hypothetical protein